MSEEFKNMLHSFRVNDLQKLLLFAGKNKNGKKSELLQRTLELVKYNDRHIESKIREIYESRRPRYDVHSYPSSKSTSAPSYNSRSFPPEAHSSYHRYLPRDSIHHPMELHSYPHFKRELPITPDVRLKPLTFYKILDVLLKPTSILNAPNDRNFPKVFTFNLSPHQISLLQSTRDIQVQMRMCVLDTSSEQMDEVPSTAKVFVNKSQCTLPRLIPTNKPGVTAPRQKLPIDITMLTKKTAVHANNIEVIYDQPYPEKLYVISITLVHQLFAEDLMKILKNKGVRNPDHTTAMIKEKLKEDIDNEIDLKYLRGSLLCPLVKIKMSFPCRSIACTHIQCFDAMNYLKMNEKKSTWSCPICHEVAEFKKLAIDGLFYDIITKVSSNCNEVQFQIDGSWTPVIPVKSQPEIPASVCDSPTIKVEEKKPSEPEVICLDDSDLEEWPNPPPKKRSYIPSNSNSPVVIDSPEDSQDNNDESIMIIDPEIPSTSTNTASTFIIPEKSSLAPLPLTLDIDPGEDTCILPDVTDISPKPTQNFASPTSAFTKPPASKEDSTPVANEPEDYDFNFYNLLSSNNSTSNINDEFTVSTSEEEYTDMYSDVISID